MTVKRRSFTPKKKKRAGNDHGLKGWFLARFSAILLSAALLLVLTVSLAALSYVIFLDR